MRTRVRMRVRVRVRVRVRLRRRTQSQGTEPVVLQVKLLQLRREVRKQVGGQRAQLVVAEGDGA